MTLEGWRTRASSAFRRTGERFHGSDGIKRDLSVQSRSPCPSWHSRGTLSISGKETARLYHRRNYSSRPRVPYAWRDARRARDLEISSLTREYLSLETSKTRRAFQLSRRGRDTPLSGFRSFANCKRACRPARLAICAFRASTMHAPVRRRRRIRRIQTGCLCKRARERERERERERRRRRRK